MKVCLFMVCWRRWSRWKRRRPWRWFGSIAIQCVFSVGLHVVNHTVWFFCRLLWEGWRSLSMSVGVCSYLLCSTIKHISKNMHILVCFFLQQQLMQRKRTLMMVIVSPKADVCQTIFFFCRHTHLWGSCCAGPRVTYIPPALPDDEDSVYAHYASGINFDKYDDITVDVSGSNPPPAILVMKLLKWVPSCF